MQRLGAEGHFGDLEPSVGVVLDDGRASKGMEAMSTDRSVGRKWEDEAVANVGLEQEEREQGCMLCSA